MQDEAPPGRRLFGAEGLDGVDCGSAARGQVAGQKCGGYEAEGGGAVGHRIDGAHFEEQRSHEAHYDDGHGKSASHTDTRQCQAVADEHPGERFLLRAEGHTNADLARVLRGTKATSRKAKESSLSK